MDRDEARAQILLSGSGDFVSLAEAAGYVRDDFPDASADTIKAKTIEAIGDLLRQALIQVGELSERFIAWDAAAAPSQIEARWMKPDRELAPWDGIWLANTPAGDRCADGLANDGRTTLQ